MALMMSLVLGALAAVWRSHAVQKATGPLDPAGAQLIEGWTVARAARSGKAAFAASRSRQALPGIRKTKVEIIAGPYCCLDHADTCA